ncbi:MAG: glycosyltransferase family 2 protein [Salinivirgaceae bacterium]
MIYLEIVFWFLLFSILYSYLIYPFSLFIISLFGKKTKKHANQLEYFPTVTLFVTAFNEAEFVIKKVENSLKLNYPKDKLRLIWVTDGSTDATNELLQNFPEVTVFYEPQRNGKVHAMNRGMQFVDSEIVIFSDGNTLLSQDTVIAIVTAFANPKVGCVAGEKRIQLDVKDNAATSGEGLYWKYESWVKDQESNMGSCMGAAGELFAIRRSLFFSVPNDTILDDFTISLKIAMQGYKIDYTPEAFALEQASASVDEEMKRKIRIAAGSFQSVFRLLPLLNIFKYGTLSWQFISHKLFRWIIIPLSLVLIIPINIILANYSSHTSLYQSIGFIQILLYFIVLLGFIFRKRKTSWGFMFVPYYFFIANKALWLGFFRFLGGKQSVKWERAKRA